MHYSFILSCSVLITCRAHLNLFILIL
jgi:hypothetical protein